MATGDIWRLSCVGSYNTAQECVITLHIRMKSSGGTFAGAAAYIKTNLLSLIATYQSASFSWTQINGSSVNLVPPQSASYLTGFPIAGSSDAQALPPQTAMVTKLATAYAGRSYRGRVYLPGMTETHSSLGTFDSTSRNAIQTYWDDLVAALGSAGSDTDYTLGVYSRKLATFNPVVEAYVRSTNYTQRRRTLGVGV